MDPERHGQWKLFKGLIATPDLPGVGPRPRASRVAVTKLTSRLEQFFRSAHLPLKLQLPLRSAALLWHDHLDESHAISQEIHDIDGSFLHGIMHRREPDYSNAKYWFQRVKQHPCFLRIAMLTTDLLATGGEKALSAQLAPQGNWDAFAFVDACETAADRSPSDRRVQTLMAVQQIEFDCLLAHLFSK